MDDGDAIVAAFAQVSATFSRLEIAWYAGGSLASGIHGMYRATADFDLIADFLPVHARSLVDALQDDFYIDEQDVLDALSYDRMFNLVHLKTSFKFDIYPVLDDPLRRSALARRRLEPCPVPGQAEFQIPVCTAEDILLAKLRWYVLGGTVSEKQWNDLLGIVQVSGPKLDLPYIRHWAAALHLTDLCSRLLTSLGELPNPPEMPR